MANGLNRATILGNLGADPELRLTSGGDAILRLRVATASSYLDRAGTRVERTEWHSVSVWGKRGEALARLLHKGSRVYVEGELRTSSYDDKDGIKRYRTEIVAREVILAGAPRSSSSSSARGYTIGAGGVPAHDDGDDAIPCEVEGGLADDPIPF